MPKKIHRKGKSLFNRGDIDAPMVEVFGGALALLIIIFILINLIVTQDIRAMLDRSTEDAKFKVSWQNGTEGLVVISYPDKLRIIETNESIPRSEICTPNNPFLRYVENIYNNSQNQQLIFAILDNGVETMAIARNCMRARWAQRVINIGWIIANQDLLSTVRLQDLPARIKKSLNFNKPPTTQ